MALTSARIREWLLPIPGSDQYWNEWFLPPLNEWLCMTSTEWMAVTWCVMNCSSKSDCVRGGWMWGPSPGMISPGSGNLFLVPVQYRMVCRRNKYCLVFKLVSGLHSSWNKADYLGLYTVYFVYVWNPRLFLSEFYMAFIWLLTTKYACLHTTHAYSTPHSTLRSPLPPSNKDIAKHPRQAPE